MPAEPRNPPEPMELAEPSAPFDAARDARPRMPETLPVKLVTVDDARLLAAAGLERALDGFYEKLLGFLRLPTTDDHVITYRAENFDLHFDVIEPPIARDTLRTLGIEVISLAEVEAKLIDLELPYARQKSFVPGRESIVLADPAGNWIELTESRAI